MADESFSDVTRELQILGDPSGRQDSQYWDEWFDVVCRKQNHRSFEWYCMPDEVLRVLKCHLESHYPPKDHSSDGASNPPIQSNYAMIHPGSGTSVLPIVLSNAFPASRQVVVDISKVAIAEMQHIHDEEQQNLTIIQSEDHPRHPIEYVVTDLLIEENAQIDSKENTETFLASSFDCWIDKGFVDAVFSDKNDLRNTIQSQRLFQEVNRILKCSNGFMIIITLAEEHSLRIIVENWLFLRGDWRPVLHIWELRPSSGDIPPFAFIVLKSDRDAGQGHGEGFSLKFHSIDSETPTQFNASCSDALIKQIHEVIRESRQQFSLSQMKKRNFRSDVPRLFATIEVKVFDAETDLMALGRAIVKMEWKTNRTLDVRWRPFTNNDQRTDCYNIVPIGYGISKLQLLCIVESDDLEELVASIEEWGSDIIQSVDIDWSNTAPIRNTDTVLRNHLTDR